MVTRSWFRIGTTAAALAAALGAASPAAAQPDTKYFSCAVGVDPDAAIALLRAFQAGERTVSTDSVGGVAVESEVNVVQAVGDRGAWTMAGTLTSRFVFDPKGPFAPLANNGLGDQAFVFSLNYSAASGMLVGSAELEDSILFSSLVTVRRAKIADPSVTDTRTEVIAKPKGSVARLDFPGALPGRDDRGDFELSLVEERKPKQRALTLVAELPYELRGRIECDAATRSIRFGHSVRWDNEVALSVRPLAGAGADPLPVAAELELRAGGRRFPVVQEGEISRSAFTGSASVALLGDGLATFFDARGDRTNGGAQLPFVHSGALHFDAQLNGKPAIPPADSGFIAERSCPAGTRC